MPLHLAVPGAQGDRRTYVCPQSLAKRPWVAELLKISRSQDRPALLPHYLPASPSAALLEGLEYLENEVSALRLIQRERDRRHTERS